MKSRLGVSLLLLLAVGCSRSASHYIDLGNKLYEQKKYEDASINYRKALQKDAKSGEAYLGLGKALLKDGKTADAYAALSQAVQMAPQSFEAKRELADLVLPAYLSDSRHPKSLYDQLNTLASEFLAHDANSYDGLRLKGYIALADKHSADAIQYFRRVLQAKPYDVDVSMVLAQTLFQDPESAGEGEKLALETINRHKDAGPAYDVMYRRYMASKRTADAENILKAKVSANPGNISYRLELAEHYRNVRDLGNMKATIAAVLNDRKTFANVSMQVGNYYSQIGDSAQAAQAFQEGARASTGNEKLTYQKRAIGVLMATHQYDLALAEIQDALQSNPKEGGLHVVRATIWIEQRKADQAIQELQAQEKEHADDPELKYELGRALLLKGRGNEAVAEWREAAKLRPSYLEPKIALAAYALEMKNPGEALRDTDQILGTTPNNLRTLLIRANALEALNRPAEAEVVLTQLKKAFPGNQQVDIEMAEFNLRQKNPVEAEKLFRGQYVPGQSIRALQGLVQAMMMQKRIDEAIRVLQADVAKAPSRAETQFLLAEVYTAAGRGNEAAQTLEQLTAAHPTSVQAFLALGQLNSGDGKLDVALADFQKAHQLEPKAIQPLLLIAETEDQLGKADLARQSYHDVLQIDPSNVMALNNLAFLDADTGNLDEAMVMITKASPQTAKEPTLTDTLGYVYLKQKKLDNAVRVFGGLTQQYPKNPTFLFHHGLALQESGNKAMAKTEFQAALAAKPGPTLAAKIKHALEAGSGAVRD